MDSRLLAEAGGDMLLTKIPSPHKSMQLTFGPGMFTHVDEGSLLVVENLLLETLWDAVARVVEDGSFRRCGIALLVGEEVLGSNDALTQMNLSLRCIWASTIVVIKPWTSRISRTDDGKFTTASIPQIAERIDQALRRLPKLLRIQVRLLSMHRSGRVVSNGPSAPSSPSKELMLSTEVCTYLRAVAEAATAKDAGNIWQPGPAPATTLKRLQPKKKRSSFKGSRGRGGSHGGYRGGRGSRGGGGSGGRGGSSRGPTIINSGIHYQKW